MPPLVADMEQTRGKGHGELEKNFSKKSTSAKGPEALLEIVKSNLRKYTTPSVETAKKRKWSELTKSPSHLQEHGTEDTTKEQAAKIITTRGPATALTKFLEASTSFLDALKFPEDQGFSDYNSYLTKTLLQDAKDDDIMHEFAGFLQTYKSTKDDLQVLDKVLEFIDVVCEEYSKLPNVNEASKGKIPISKDVLTALVRCLQTDRESDDHGSVNVIIEGLISRGAGLLPRLIRLESAEASELFIACCSWVQAKLELRKSSSTQPASSNQSSDVRRGVRTILDTTGRSSGTTFPSSAKGKISLGSCFG